MSAKCSKEDIERKRLAALQKRQSKIVASAPLTNSPASDCSHNTNVTTHLNDSKEISGHVKTKLWSAKAASPIKHFSSNHERHPYAKIPSLSKPFSETSSRTSLAKVVSGTVYVITEDRFEVNTSEFCGPLIDVFKKIPSKNYDGKTKCWSFLLSDYKLLMDKVALLSPDVVLGSIPTYVLKVLESPKVDLKSISLLPVEPSLRNKLMPFQEEAVRFGVSLGGRCMLADDMGLGKTFQALALTSYYRADWPLLVVTTSSMRDTWTAKIQELLPSVPMMDVVTLRSRADTRLVADVQTQVVIVSFKTASTYGELLQNKKFGVVIIDECHHLKSPKAQCTAALRRVCARARRALLLSGTPALSRPVELYSQLQLLEPRALPNYVDFGKRYCAGKATPFGWDMSGQSNLAELRVLLARRFLIRRTKRQALHHHLAEKTREAVLLDPALVRGGRGAGVARAASSPSCSSSGGAVRGGADRGALLALFAQTATDKMAAVCKYVRQLVREGEGKMLIFAHHGCMIDALCLTLDELQTGYICITGATRTDHRAELVERFQTRGGGRGGEGCRAAVLSLTACGAGVTLTAAATVVFAELHWNPGILQQAECRAHRLGQARAVRVLYLLARGTADDLLWPMLQTKLDVLNEVGLSKDTFEDSALKEQKSQNTLDSFLKQNSSFNRNDFIPGTNIRKGTLKEEDASSEIDSNIELGDCDFSLDEFSSDFAISLNETCENVENHRQVTVEDIDKSFLDDDDGDELLANLDF